MKPAWNRGRDSNVVLLMEREEEMGTGDWDDVPVTQRCVYVQDRDSQKWFARTSVSVDVEAIASAK